MTWKGENMQPETQKEKEEKNTEKGIREFRL